MGLIRAEISMSQPANVVYTHKKFKRTSSSSHPPWAGGGVGGEGAGDVQPSSLSDGASNGGAEEHHGVSMEGVAAYTRQRTLPEARVEAPSIVSIGGPALGSPRRPTNGLCDNLTKALQRGDGLNAQHDDSNIRLRCSHCQVICDSERNLHEHVLSHLFPDAACARCGSKDNSCSCKNSLKSQLFHFPSANIHNPSVNSSRSSPVNCSFADKYPQPADLSLHSTNHSNNHAYPTTASQPGDYPSSNASSEGAALKSIYKPKFRASYSLDESSLSESGVSGLFATRISETLTDSTRSSDPNRTNASSTYQPNISNCSSQSAKKSGVAVRTSLSVSVATSLGKQEDPSPARGLSSLVGTGLWKDIKSPSPDIGEHIDKIIVQNQVIMDSDNPLLTRKYRRQSSIGSSSSESDGSSGPRNRRCSVTDSSGKSKPPSSLQLGLLSHQNRFRNAFQSDGVPAVTPSLHPSDLLTASTSVNALKRSLSSVGLPAPVTPHYRPAAPFLPSAALLEAHRRGLPTDVLAALTPASGATEHDLLRQHLLSMPDSEANKILLARGHALALQGTSIVPVTNAAALQLVCPNCSASFRNRESLQLHIERHCDAVLRSQSSQVNYSYRVQVADQQARTVNTKPDAESQEVALDLIKKVHAASDDPHTYLRGSSLGAEVRLNPDHARFNSQYVRFHKSMSPFTRQSSLEPAIPPNKKRRLSSDPPGGDNSVKSVHPVFLHNGVVFQKANVSIKNVEEIKKNVGKNQMYGGEVKICDGAEYKTIKIDTTEGSRSLALDMCLTAPSQDTRSSRPESPVPTSLVVTLSKSGLICGGTVVESRVCMSKAAPTNLVYSRSSSDHGPLDRAAAASHPGDDLHRMSRDASEGIISSLQRYAPQLQLPNLSIPGVPIPNITGVMLPKLITNKSGMQTSRLLSGSDNQTTSAFCLDSSSNLPSIVRPPTADHVAPSIIPLSKEKLVPYVPGIPGPYSQASSNMMHVNASLAKCSSPVVVSPSAVLLTSAARKLKAFPQPADTPHQVRQSPAHRIDCTLSENPLGSPASSLAFGPSVSESKSSPDVPSVLSAVVIALDIKKTNQAATEAKIIPVPNVPPDVALSLTVAPKETFLMPRKRPDTLPLKPHQFTPKSSALLVGSTIMSPDTPRPKKSCAQLLLNGSAYTYLGLKVSTKTYYCCIHRPQPMYVPHTPDSKISMYSNWERKPAAENPFNLSISESMGLYTSGSCTDRAYTVAKPKSLDYIITCSDDKLKAAMEHLKRQERLSAESSLPADETSSPPPENSTVKNEVSSCKEAVCSSSSSSNTAGSTTTGSSKDGNSGRTTKRIKIFDGGFKSTEEYTYVRGRGRGRYVCETCGIRCKKPSMLKKHIRSHTNLRPYPCHHCTSRFKTKGNLTKHLKSKAHYKRCMQLGVPPDPPLSSHDDAMDCDDDDGDDEDDDDDDDVDDDDDEDDDECDDDMRDSSSRERSRARSDSREPRRNDTRESSRESSADEMPGSSSSSSCSSSSERAAEQSYPSAVDVLAPTPGLPSSTLLGHDDVLMTPVDLSTSHNGPASSASADDAPMDLSVRKEASHVPAAAARVSSVTCTFTSLAMVPRPTSLSVIPAPRAPNLPSPLSLRSPMTPIREQPADILSPVTESSMLLKSIYNTTERATKATTALHIGSHHSQGWLNKEKSGVMMTAYLTERAIQDTFMKRHQYQGAISNSSAFAEKDDMDNDPPATLPTVTAPRHSLLSVSSVSTGLPGMTSTLSDSKSMQFQSTNADQTVQSPGSLKLKKYYCGKWENSEAPASCPVVANLATSNGSTLTTVLSGAQLMKLPQSAMMNLSSTSLLFPKVEPKDEPVKCAVNIHNNSGLTIVQMNSTTIPKGILLLPSDSKFLPTSTIVPGTVPAYDPPLAENKIIPSVPTTNLKNNKNTNNSVDKYSFEPSTQGVNMLPNSALLPVTSATANQALTRQIPKMTLIKTPSGTIIAVSSVQPHTAQSLKQSASPSLRSGSPCPIDGDLPSCPSTVTSQHSIAPANALSASLQSCLTRMNVSCASTTASINNRALKATTTSTVSAVYFSTPASTCSSSIAKSLYTTNSTALTALTQTSDSLKSDVFVEPTLTSSEILTNASPSSYSLSNLSATTMTVSSSSLASINLLSKALAKQSPVVTMTTCLPTSSPGPSAASRSSVVTTAPSSAVNLTVLNRGDAKNGASFLSPSGVVPSSSSNRPAPEDGRCRCCVCHKEFARSSQLTLHMNIHYMERPFRCVTCAVSFRTSGHLQKHKRSASHFNKVNMNLTFGAASTENPRPFKCHDCQVAFRIHGHLAKHLRSKMHILKLECLRKLPFGVYAEMERTGLTLANIDTSDCENSLISLQALANQLFAKEPGKLLAWQNGTAEPPPSPSEWSEDPDQPSRRTRTISNSSTNSDDYPLADDQDDPPAGDSGEEGLGSPSAPSRPSTEATPPPTPSSLTPRRCSSSPAAPSPLVSSTNNNMYKLMMVPQLVPINQSLSCASPHLSSSSPSTASSSDHNPSPPSSGPFQPSTGIGCTSTAASGATTLPSSVVFSSSTPLAVSRALVTPTSSSCFIPSGQCVLATSIARSTSSAHLLTVSSVRRDRQASAVVTLAAGGTIASLMAGAEDASPPLPPR